MFQPHRYTRTEKLWNNFITTFAQSGLDTLIITDIYSAGELPIDTITSARLAQELISLNPPFAVQYVPFEEDFTQIKQSITQSIGKNDLLLFLGAGKVYHLAEELAE